MFQTVSTLKPSEHVRSKLDEKMTFAMVALIKSASICFPVKDQNFFSLGLVNVSLWFYFPLLQ